MGSSYPEPLVVAPTRSHKQTFILLHGRGSSASKFGPPLLETSIPNIGNLTDAFSHARFVFLTASQRRATIYKRSIINQWFDNWSLVEPAERQDLQIDGLRESSAFIHDVIKQEAKLVGGAGNVVLGGLSQGCAASLIALLLWDGGPLAAVFGMCGWLPFGEQMKDILRGIDASRDGNVIDGEDYNPFADADADADHGDHYDDNAPTDDVRAVMHLREELDLPVVAFDTLASFQQTPILLGHGKDDEKVPVELGREASRCIKSLGANVMWKEYEGLGHWYSSEMLFNIVAFVRKHTAWE